MLTKMEHIRAGIEQMRTDQHKQTVTTKVITRDMINILSIFFLFTPEEYTTRVGCCVRTGPVVGN